MIETMILAVLGIAVCAYAITAGADFGVGILATFSRKTSRGEIRKLGEKAIAPVWEANHVWIILALVIVFVGFPKIHVAIANNLHFPMLLLLGGVIARGTAFTFRYYDVREADNPMWTVLFRGGSIATPFFFGALAATLRSGSLTQNQVSVWDKYLAPWLGAFPLATGLFAVTLFAWIAAVFLIGEVDAQQRELWFKRARLWGALTVAAGALVTITASLSDVAVLESASRSPIAYICVVLASGGMLLTVSKKHALNPWLARPAAAITTVSILAGYFLPGRAAIYFSEGKISWAEAAAPASTMNALALALVVGALLIFPGIWYLFRVFKSATR